jgi:hypothetical protein
MKKITFAILFAIFVFTIPPAFATPVNYTFNPYDSSGQVNDLDDLDHSKYYVWLINSFSLAANEHVTGATLTFNNIYNWQRESGDQLYIHLLDNKPSLSLSLIREKTGVDAILGAGVKTYNTKLFTGTDNQGGGDKFNGIGTKITPVWSDPDDNRSDNDLVYDFAHLGGYVDTDGDIVNGTVSILAILEQYMRNGDNFALGFDPDCHYYNDKVTFIVTTETTSAPEPGTLLLLGAGVSALAAIGWRRRRTRI